jgi:3-hydroxyisobutyrate dehydrogenase
MSSMNNEDLKCVGFVGTGIMGAPMAHRLLASGLRVQVWNRSRDKLKPLLAAGAHAAASAAEAASGTDAVFLCLSNATAVEAAVFSDGGVAHAQQAPSLLVDFSTIGPAHTLKFAARLRERSKTEWVDAPVSGGVPGAEQGKLVIFCGGSTSNLARLRRVFEVLAQRCTRAGELGSGQTLKLCNQLIVATNLAAIAEALALARASGLKMTILPEALAGGFADSLPLQIFGTRMAAGVDSPVLGELSLMLKDMNAIADLSEACGERLGVSAAALEVYRLAERRGLARKDLSALIELYPANSH